MFRSVIFNYSGTDYIYIYIIYPVHWPKLILTQPTWSAYPYHLVFLIWYPYALVFIIWYPYALTFLYGNTAHCSGYGVAMGCYGLFIVPRTVIVTSQWYGRYCFTEYARTWARHLTTPWQRKCTAITGCQSIESLLDSTRFVTHFWEITPYTLRGGIVGLVHSLGYSINSGIRPLDNLSGWWLGWRRHARVGKPFFGKSLDF